MSSTQILVLGAVAGATIFIGLPLGRLQTANVALKAALSATATGILLFLLYDVIHGSIEPVDEALTSATDGGSWGHFAWFAALFAAGISAGYLSLVYYDGWMKRKRSQGDARPGRGIGCRVRAVLGRVALGVIVALSLLIATGIGLHNFSEGLAIGQAGATGEISLAIVLIIGFGLHNATEGFGIVAPLSGEPVRPSWRFLLLLGLIGGGPTFVGTLIGQAWVSESLSIAVPRARRRLDPLRRARARRRQPADGLEALHRLVRPPRPPARVRHRVRRRSRRGLAPAALGWDGGVRLRLSARLRPRGRAPVHVRGAGRRGEGRRRRGAVRRAAQARGVVVGLEEAPPDGVKAAPVGRVLDELPPALVDLALWVAEYYGSTPARALELVAPRQAGATRGAARRRRTGSPARPRPNGSRPSRRPRSTRIVEAVDARRRPLPALRRDRQRQDRGLPPGVRGRARARARRDRARPRDRAHAAGGRPLPGALRRAHRAAPLGDDRGRAPRRA